MIDPFSLNAFFVNGAINGIRPVIEPRISSLSPVLSTRTAEVLEFRLQIQPFELYQLLSLLDEVSAFSVEEAESLDEGLNSVSYPPYEPVEIDEAFRLRMTVDFNRVVEAFNRGIARPLMERLLTSPVVDGKAFAYLLAVLQHPQAKPEDFYLAMQLVLRDFPLTSEDLEIITEVLQSSGLNPPSSFQELISVRDRGEIEE